MSSTYRRRPASPRRARQVPYVPDPCPACASDLGGPAGTTRRTVVFSTDRGVFRWRCPDCRHVWEDGPEPTRPRPAVDVAAQTPDQPASGP